MKKQKVASSGALAIPEGGNSIPVYSPHANISLRNICIHHWYERQPGGQGLLADFEEYFKSLSDTDREVCLRSKQVYDLNS
jgi:hypothetical protein